MVDFSLATDDFGLLHCSLSDGKTQATARASNVTDSVDDLLGALDNAGSKGVGECFWPLESGAYRWLIRRDQQRVRLVVLWSIGTMTGWENVFWSDGDWAPLEESIRHGVARFRSGV